MKAVFTIQGKEFKVSAVVVAHGVPFPYADSKDKTKHYKYRVTITTDTGRTSFAFFGSHAQWCSNDPKMSDSDLKHALYCFISDSVSGKQSFLDFCSELGYSEDSRRAERIYKACFKMAAKWERITDVDMHEAANELND
jgi:hypothetical protein